MVTMQTGSGLILNRQAFNRRAELRIGQQFENRVIPYPEIEFDFTVDFTQSKEDNVLQCTVYNLADTTTSWITRGARAILSAGYGDDIGTVFVGSIDYVDGDISGTERHIYFEAYDRLADWLNIRIQRSYRRNVKASAIISDIARTYGLALGDYQLHLDPVYPKGKSYNGTLRQALTEVLKDCRTGFNVSNGLFYIGNRPNRTTTVLNENTGLIGSPRRIEDEDGIRWAVNSLLNHKIQPGVVVRIESRGLNGNFKVVRGRHIKGSDFITEMEVEGL